jgi:hypothetical protein
MVKNSKGCTSSPYVISISINKYYIPTPIVKIVKPSCGVDGSISVLSSASEYSFDGGTTWGTNPIISKPIPNKTYSIVVKNSQGCTSYPYYANVSTYNLPSPNVSTVQPTCSEPYGTIYINTYSDQYSFDGEKPGVQIL